MPVEDRASERMHFRARPHVKRTIQRAAALRGVDESVFTMSAAYASALETIAVHERTELKPIDHAAFFAALEEAPEPTARLSAAFTRHRDRVTSR